MDIWETLGIRTTTDITAIKKAYAARAKECHPEEHPEEFKRLQTAYRAAVTWAKKGAEEKAEGYAQPEPAAAGERPEEKPEEKRQERPEEKPGEQPEGKPQERPEEQPEGKPQERPEEKPGEQPEEKPQERPEEQPQERPEGKPQERPEGKPGERPQEQSAESGTEEQEADSENQFSYDDVSFFYQKELAEQFFREFYRIVWNPYLQNRRAVWSYFLFQPDYNDLFFHEGFRQKLLREICFVPGWYSDILDYFEWWLGLYRETDRKEIPGAKDRKGHRDDSRMETDGWRWRLKKLRSKFTCYMPEHVVSSEQRQKHYEILQTMRERGYDTSFLNAASASAYLKYYDAFAEDNEEWLENQQRISCRKRLKYRVVFGVLALLLTIILIVTLFVKPALDAAEEARARERRAEEEAASLKERESREQEEWQDKLDERFENMREQYDEWMENAETAFFITL